MLYDDLDGGMVGWDGREVQEGGDICILWLVHVDIRQKPSQYCKAVILQLIINKFKTLI